MSKPFMPKAALHFEVVLEKPNDPACFKAAQQELLQQLVDYTAAVTKNPNALVADITLILQPEDYVKRAEAPVNVHLAELAPKTPANKTLPKEVKKVVKPAPVAPAPVVREEEPEDNARPVVVAMTTEEYNAKRAAVEAEEAAQLTAAALKKTTKVVPATTPAPAVAGDPVADIVEKVFTNLKRTEKSVTIVTAFAKAGKEMTLEELMAATKLNKNDISSWLQQTGKSVKAIVKPSRGVYKLDPDKV